MPKILIIDKCYHCEHYEMMNRKGRAVWWCHNKSREMDSLLFEIPEWCPLPDAEVKDEE